MTLSLIFLMALAAVAATLLTLIRIVGWRRVLRHATLIDVVFTVVICFALAGTLTGLLIGIVAGLVMAGALSVAKALVSRVEALRASQSKPVEEDWCPGGAPGKL